MTITPEIREFNTTDWMLLAGAEPFADGHDPLVVDNFPYLDMTMAADRSGITLLTEDSEYKIPSAEPDKATHDIMKEIFEAVVGCIFYSSKFDLKHYIAGFGFKKIY